MYINDLPECRNNTRSRLFADDTNLTASGNSLADIELAVSSDLDNIRNWLIANKLSLNVANTEFMLIGSPQMIRNVSNFQKNILIENKQIRQVYKTKTLKCPYCFKLFLAISNLGMISSISVKKIFNLGKSFDFYGVLNSAFDGSAQSYFVTTKSLGLASFLRSSKVVGIYSLDQLINLYNFKFRHFCFALLVFGRSFKDYPDFSRRHV